MGEIRSDATYIMTGKSRVKVYLAKGNMILGTASPECCMSNQTETCSSSIRPNVLLDCGTPTRTRCVALNANKCVQSNAPGESDVLQ